MWTQFWDMHSGGGLKEKWHYIYIEAENEDQAKIIFYNRFGHNPERVSCTCCGEDYSIDSHESFAQVSGYQRTCPTLETPRNPDGTYRNDDPVIKKGYYLEKGKKPPKGYEIAVDRYPGLHGTYQTVAQFKKRDDVKVIPKSSVKASERKGTVPSQGYVWVE